MKIKIVALALFGLILSASCKKKEHAETEKEPEKISIGNKVYTTVKIGDLVWTDVNYSGEGGIWNDGTTSKPEYGKYYTYQELQQIVIPAGWRIPTENDFQKLYTAVGVSINAGQISNAEKIKSLTSKTNWKHIAGTNASGFNAFPGGYSVNNAYPLDGDLSEFWVAGGKTFSIMERGDQAGYTITFYANTGQPLDRFNVRFVKDANSGNLPL